VVGQDVVIHLAADVADCAANAGGDELCGDLRMWIVKFGRFIAAANDPLAELAEVAAGVFDPERIEVVPRLDDALERAISFADAPGEEFGDSIGSAGVLVTGSVVTVGEARTLLRGTGSDPA